MLAEYRDGGICPGLLSRGFFFYRVLFFYPRGASAWGRDNMIRSECICPPAAGPPNHGRMCNGQALSTLRRD